MTRTEQINAQAELCVALAEGLRMDITDGLCQTDKGSLNSYKSWGIHHYTARNDDIRKLRRELMKLSKLISADYE